MITDLQKSQKMENQATWMVSETLLRKLEEEEEKEDMHRV